MSRTAPVGLVLVLLAASLAHAQERARDHSQALRATPGEPAAERWLYSETVSPLDYAPVVIASAWSSNDGPDPALQLSIQCRRGRTDLVVASPGLAGRPEEQRVVWAIGGGPPLSLAVGPAPTGTGVAVRDDVVRLLGTLPAEGELALEVTMPQKPALRGRYAIAPLKAVLGRMAASCRWPAQHP